MSRDRQKHFLVPSVMLTTNAWKRKALPKQEEPVSVVEALKLVGEKLVEVEKKLEKQENSSEKEIVIEKQEIPEKPSEVKRHKKQKIHYDPIGRKQDLFNLALQNHLPVNDQHTKAQIINMIVEHNNSL